MVRVMYEVASGTELAVLELVVVSAHLLPENRLVHHQFFHSMREEAVVSIAAMPGFSKATAKLEFSLLGKLCDCFIIYQNDAHMLNSLINYRDQMASKLLLEPFHPPLPFRLCLPP